MLKHDMIMPVLMDDIGQLHVTIQIMIIVLDLILVVYTCLTLATMLMVIQFIQLLIQDHGKAFHSLN